MALNFFDKKTQQRGCFKLSSIYPFLSGSYLAEWSSSAIPFQRSGSSEQSDWVVLPVTIALLVQDDRHMLRQPLHKAEKLEIAEFSFITQACRSYRYAAELIYDNNVVLHAYWGMGLYAQHRLIDGLVIRFNSSHPESLSLVSKIIQLTDSQPMSPKEPLCRW